MDLYDLPEHIEKAIITPHEHEHETRPPLWILWKLSITKSDGFTIGPQIDAIANSEDSARYHYCAMVESYAGSFSETSTFYVERIPANHRFASSMEEVFTDSTLRMVDIGRRSTISGNDKWSYKREGD